MAKEKGEEMTWKEIYNKYKDTELMKEFYFYWYQFQKYDELQKMLGQIKAKEYAEIHGGLSIKDIWGYLIVFAETKGWYLEYGNIMGEKYLVSVHNINVRKNGYIYDQVEKNLEQAMLWCADKFFEIGV